MGGRCAMLDACRYHETVDSIQRMLTRNFIRNENWYLILWFSCQDYCSSYDINISHSRHYTDSTKPPFPMAFHAAWFRARPHRETAVANFIDSLLQFPDVYFVTTQQLLRWISDPVPLGKFNSSSNCDISSRKAKICQMKKCSYGSRMFVTCSSCPDQYPWI